MGKVSQGFNDQPSIYTSKRTPAQRKLTLEGCARILLTTASLGVRFRIASLGKDLRTHWGLHKKT